MRLRISHETHYDYGSPVFLEPHTLRLKPATTAFQHLMSFDLGIDPAPAGLSEMNDIHGNAAALAWFEDVTSHLTIRAESHVETHHANPFDYLWLGPTKLPLTYLPETESALAPYRQATESAAVQQLASEVAVSVGGDAQAYLPELARSLQERLRWIFRAQGPPVAPEETLKRGEGSCRDMAALFLAAATSQGFAARFVSGYHFEEGAERFELHAWAEAFVPGGGWRGFDPSTGLAVADRHVVIAVAPCLKGAAPIEGNFRGAATGQLQTNVRIARLS